MVCYQCNHWPCLCDRVFPDLVALLNPLAYVVREECNQCHRQVSETRSGVCLDCDYVNRATESIHQ